MYENPIPIPRFDAANEPDGNHRDGDAEKDGDFLHWLRSETELNYEAMTRHERYYLSRAYEMKTPEQRKEMSQFLLHYQLDGCSAMVATEYHPALSARLVDMFIVSRKKVPGGFHEFEQSEDGVALRQMIGGFGRFFAEVEEISCLIRESEIDEGLPQTDREELGDQIFEAFSRKGADLIHVFCLIRECAHGSEVFSLDDVSRAMDACQEALKMLRNFFDEDFRKDGMFSFERMEEKKGQNPKFHVTNRMTGEDCTMKWFVRPRASAEGQARVGLEFGYDTPHANHGFKDLFYQETARLKDGVISKTEKESVLRISIDRDTTHGEPGVSMDMGRAAFRGKTFDRTGDKLGNMLALASPEGSHTPHSFDSKFAEEDRFAAIASGFAEYISRPQST